MQTSTSDQSNSAVRKAFGPLALYKNRVFLSANESTESELLNELKSAYKLEELEIKVDTLERGEKSKEFRYVEVPGLPRIYLVQLINHGIGLRRVTDVYELAVDEFLGQENMAVAIGPQSARDSRHLPRAGIGYSTAGRFDQERTCHRDRFAVRS